MNNTKWDIENYERYEKEKVTKQRKNKGMTKEHAEKLLSEQTKA